MTFHTPSALFLLLLVPALATMYAYAARRRREALRMFLGGRESADIEAASRTARLRRWRALLVVLGAALMVVAVARPLYGTERREARQESLDLLILLDVSASMLAEDAPPDRLARARLAISQIVDARPGDRFGLVVFAGDAFLQCPLTTDRSAFRLFLDTADPSLLAVPGTDFGDALRTASLAFVDDGEPAPPRPRAVLIVSDGEDHEGDLEPAVRRLRDDGVALLAVGVGTDEGAPVPQIRNGRRTGIKTDDDGEPIISRLEAGVLRDIAGREGYTRLADGGVAEIVARLDRLDRAVFESAAYEAGAERFQWPLAIAILFLIGERLLALKQIRT